MCRWGQSQLLRMMYIAFQRPKDGVALEVGPLLMLLSVTSDIAYIVKMSSKIVRNVSSGAFQLEDALLAALRLATPCSNVQ